MATAEAHGRAALAKDLRGRIRDNLSERSYSSHSDSENQHIDQVDVKRDVDDTVDTVLGGMHSEEHWVSSKGDVFVLMMIDQESFDSALAQANTKPRAASRPAEPSAKTPKRTPDFTTDH